MFWIPKQNIELENNYAAAVAKVLTLFSLEEAFQYGKMS